MDKRPKGSLEQVGQPHEIETSEEVDNKDTTYKFRRCEVIVLGSIQIAVGVICIGMQSALIDIDEERFAVLSRMGYGIWIGVGIIACGCASVIAGIRLNILVICVANIIGLVLTISVSCLSAADIRLYLDTFDDWYPENTLKVTTLAGMMMLFGLIGQYMASRMIIIGSCVKSFASGNRIQLSLPGRSFKVLGVIQMLFGVSDHVLQCLLMTVYTMSRTPSNYHQSGYCIWCGAMFFLCGYIGYASGKYKYRYMVTATICLCVTCLVLAALQIGFVVSDLTLAINYHSDSEMIRSAFPVLLSFAMAMGILQLISSAILIILKCLPCCGYRTKPTETHTPERRLSKIHQPRRLSRNAIHPPNNDNSSDTNTPAEEEQAAYVDHVNHGASTSNQTQGHPAPSAQNKACGVRIRKQNDVEQHPEVTQSSV